MYRVRITFRRPPESAHSFVVSGRDADALTACGVRGWRASILLPGGFCWPCPLIDVPLTLESLYQPFLPRDFYPDNHLTSYVSHSTAISCVRTPPRTIDVTKDWSLQAQLSSGVGL